METKLITGEDHVDFFINMLRQTSGNWDGPLRSWIFRGQREYKWGLIPSVFRSDIINKWADLSFDVNVSEAEFMEKEIILIRKFVKIADSVGLKVPGDCYEFRIKNYYAAEDWPPKKHIEIFAIAQHHGLPTRLLDFTHNAFTAAFFSAIDCKEKKDINGDLAIWAINIGEYYNLINESERSIQLVSVPTHDNHYLNAQQGIFLYDKKLYKKWNNSIPFNEIDFNVENIINKDLEIVEQRQRKELKPLIWKISFSKQQYKMLLSKLIEENYHYASLMPSYKRVIDQMKLEDDFEKDRF
jgi:hypothetical protein